MTSCIEGYVTDAETEYVTRLLEHDTQIARWMRMIAWLMCICSIAIAVWSAVQQPRTQLAESSGQSARSTSSVPGSEAGEY